MEKYGSSTDLCAGCRMRVLMARPRGFGCPAAPGVLQDPAACSSSCQTANTHFEQSLSGQLGKHSR